MNFFLQLLLLVSSALHTAAASTLPSSSLPSLYVFGASMVDTGENFVAMPYKQDADFEPYGSDYFGQPTGRWSNGRNFMDLITQELGMGLLSPYLQAIGSNFTHGVNFACSGARAQNSTAELGSSAGLFSLLVQIDQFRQFQRLVLLQHKGVLHESRMRQHFSNSVYFIEIGTLDYLEVAFRTEDFDAVAFTVAVIGAIRVALQALYHSGARTIVVMNLSPLGCDPYSATTPFRTENRDEYGCKLDYLEIANMHNQHLAELLSELSSNNYSAAEWILFDAYSIMLDGYQNPSKYGVEYPFQACCGFGGGMYNFDVNVRCGKPEATKCEDPSLHIIWDSAHPVESFCRYLGQGVLNGTHLSPTINITKIFRSDKHHGIEQSASVNHTEVT